MCESKGFFLSFCISIQHPLHTRNKLRLCWACWHLKDSLLWDYTGSSPEAVWLSSVFASPVKGRDIILRYCLFFFSFYGTDLLLVAKTSTSQLQFTATTLNCVSWLIWPITTSLSGWDTVGIRYHTFSSSSELCFCSDFIFYTVSETCCLCWNLQKHKMITRGPRRYIL